MKEKINDYPIDRPLTAARRKKINQFIENNAGRLGRPVSAEWDESGTVLLLASDPVKWEFVFHSTRVEAFGTAPFWVKMLFTEKRRKVVDEVVMQLLEEAGFLAAKPAADSEAETPAPAARKKSASQKGK
jgi:hypothetical protein